MSTRIIELGFAKKKLSIVISKEFEQFNSCQKVGLQVTRDGIFIRAGGKSATLSDGNMNRYPAWRVVFGRCQWEFKQEFAQVPVHFEEMPDGRLKALWPEPDMIKPPRSNTVRRREKLDYDTARAMLLELCGSQSTFEAVVEMADDFIRCLEIVRDEEERA